MALLFADSFDGYTTAQITRKWTSIDGTGSTTIGAYGRNGTNGMRIMPQFGNATLNLTTNAATMIVGGAIMLTSTAIGQRMFHFRDNGTVQVLCQFNGDGSISVINGAGVTLGSTAPGAMPTPTAVHNFVEMKVTSVHDTTGGVVLRVNNAVVLTLINVDTKQSANAYMNQLYMEGYSNWNNQLHIDDIYVCDGTGSEHNDFLGDVHWQRRKVNGAGSSAQFTPSASTNDTNVDDATSADDDATYNASSTVGHKDMFTCEDPTASTGSVVAVVINSVDRKDDAGARTHVHRVRLSGTELAGAAFAPTTAYANHQSIFPTKPGGGVWTLADVTAMEIGYENAS